MVRSVDLPGCFPLPGFTDRDRYTSGKITTASPDQGRTIYAPGSEIAQVWWADGGWRVLSAPIEAPIDSARAEQPTSVPAPGQTVAVRASGVERLPMLDAYAGLVNQAHRDGQLLEAIYRRRAPVATEQQARAEQAIEHDGQQESKGLAGEAGPMLPRRRSVEALAESLGGEVVEQG